MLFHFDEVFNNALRCQGRDAEWPAIQEQRRSARLLERLLLPELQRRFSREIKSSEIPGEEFRICSRSYHRGIIYRQRARRKQHLHPFFRRTPFKRRA